MTVTTVSSLPRAASVRRDGATAARRPAAGDRRPNYYDDHGRVTVVMFTVTVVVTLTSLSLRLSRATGPGRRRDFYD